MLTYAGIPFQKRSSTDLDTPKYLESLWITHLLFENYLVKASIWCWSIKMEITTIETVGNHVLSHPVRLFMTTLGCNLCNHADVAKIHLNPLSQVRCLWYPRSFNLIKPSLVGRSHWKLKENKMFKSYGKPKRSLRRARDSCTSRTFDCDHLLFTWKALVALVSSLVTSVRVMTMICNTYRAFTVKYANALLK